MQQGTSGAACDAPRYLRQSRWAYAADLASQRATRPPGAWAIQKRLNEIQRSAAVRACAAGQRATAAGGPRRGIHQLRSTATRRRGARLAPRWESRPGRPRRAATRDLLHRLRAGGRRAVRCPARGARVLRLLPPREVPQTRRPRRQEHRAAASSIQKGRQ